MKNFVVIVLATLTMSSNVVLATAEPSAQEIVSRSDEIRNPTQPFRLDNKLTEYESGIAKNEMKLVIFAKEDKATGQYKNVVLYREPARDAGKIVLLNGTKMWFYDPSSKASVRISPQQRLIGQASEGDVLSVNLAKDYNAKILGKESVDDADRKTASCWRLELTPAREDAVYNKVDYWVEESTFRPVKAKFYSDSGRLLKIAYYHQYELQLGVKRPTEVIIIDAVNSKLVTTMNFSNYQEKVIPESWFQREYLPHLRTE